MEENRKIDNIKFKQVPESMKFVPPVEVVSEIMKKKSGELKDLQSRYEKELEADDKVFSLLAVQAYSLSKILDRYASKLQEAGMKPLYDELRITRNKLSQALEKGGITITDLTGREVDDTVLEFAEVIGWLPDEREKEHVVETYEPFVKHGDKVIHMAKVTGGTRSLIKEETPADQPAESKEEPKTDSDVEVKQEEDSPNENQ